MTESKHHHHVLTTRDVFLAPLILGVATIVGLLSALFGDGAWDGLSWLTLLCPLAVVGLAWTRRDRSGKTPG